MNWVSYSHMYNDELTQILISSTERVPPAGPAHLGPPIRKPALADPQIAQGELAFMFSCQKT